MIYGIIMLSRSRKTHKVPSTESKTHTGSRFPLTAPVPPEYVQHKLPLPASTTQRDAPAGRSGLPTGCTLHVMPLREKRAGEPPADAGVRVKWPGDRGCIQAPWLFPRHLMLESFLLSSDKPLHSLSCQKRRSLRV